MFQVTVKTLQCMSYYTIKYLQMTCKLQHVNTAQQVNNIQIEVFQRVTGKKENASISRSDQRVSHQDCGVAHLSAVWPVGFLTEFSTTQGWTRTCWMGSLCIGLCLSSLLIRSLLPSLTWAGYENSTCRMTANTECQILHLSYLKQTNTIMKKIKKI